MHYTELLFNQFSYIYIRTRINNAKFYKLFQYKNRLWKRVKKNIFEGERDGTR